MSRGNGATWNRIVAGAAALALAGACSSDDGASPTDPVAVSPSAPTAATSPTTGVPSGGTGASDPTRTDPSGTGTPSSTARPAATSETTPDVAEVTMPEVTVPETGVPGLDSDVVVCRAWSEFAGSYQVVAVAAAFGDDTAEVARLEVAASPVVTGAYDDMIANWPDELTAEADVVADEYLGPYARRSARARDALIAAGADEAVLAELTAAWIDALAARDPAEVLPTLVVPPSAVDVVEAAAVDFDAQVVPIPQDPSLVTGAEVPLTEAFLFDTCPDRGTLGGAEVGG